MSGNQASSRPISPHLQIYRPQITWTVSITHRLTGVALSATAVLVVWWFLALSTGPQYFAVADSVLRSWFGDLVLTLSAWAIWFHFLNGIRHLVWDTGHGMGMKRVARTGWTVIILSVVLTLVTIWIGWGVQ